MIRFETTGMVVARPRAGQLTAESQRAYWEKNQGKVGFSGEWREPGRYGVNSKGRHTRIRLATEGEHQQTADFWINDYEVTGATFEKLLALEIGDRVKLTGYISHSNSYFTSRPTHVRFFPTPKLVPGYEFVEGEPRLRTDDEARALREQT